MRSRSTRISTVNRTFSVSSMGAMVDWYRRLRIGIIPSPDPYIGTRPIPATAPTSAPTLLERERELAGLGTALDGAAAGRGGTVAVVGEPGIGKSRLLAEARERARGAGMLVCSARGAELERAFPFGIVRQLAASSYADTTREERSA